MYAGLECEETIIKWPCDDKNTSKFWIYFNVVLPFSFPQASNQLRKEKLAVRSDYSEYLQFSSVLTKFLPQLLSFLSIIISWNNIQFESSRSDSYSDRCQVREEIKSHSTPSSHQLGETSFWKNQCRIWPSASADLKLKIYEAAIINSR